ncbi:MAG: cell division protein FtsL [Gammaproteobacteria bacterium]|nr:MAG: cell division protein FtsL [Gammaproteobacteria bacterium]PIE37537.1 MAG: cell division protein FtsL [Gammaproteobacteria bacterium]
MAGKSARQSASEVQVVRQSNVTLGVSAVLLVLVAVSAAASLYVSHLCRGQYRQAQALENQVWMQQVEYGRMLLEQSALAPPHKVESVAVEKLGMALPNLFNTRLVK